MASRKSNKDTVEADARTIEIARKLRDARDNTKRWGEIADVLRDELIHHSAEIAVGEGVDPDDVKTLVSSGVKVASISVTTRHVFDREAFEKAHPEINLDDYQKVSSSTTVRIGKI